MSKINLSERELLLQIEERPGLFVETVSYKRMISFLEGFQYGRAEGDWYQSWLGHTYPHLPFYLFGAYVFLYLEAPSNTARGWTSMISYVNDEDEVKSMATFFEIFHAYDLLKIEDIHTYTLTDDQIDYGFQKDSYYFGISPGNPLDNRDIKMKIHKVSNDYGYFATVHNNTYTRVLSDRVGPIHRQIFSTLDKCEERARNAFGATVYLEPFDE